MHNGCVETTDIDILHQPQLTLRYKSSDARRGLYFMAAFSPFWLFWLPYAIFWIGQAVVQAGLATYLDMDLLTLFLCGLLATCLAIIAICRNNQLVISTSGVKLPFRFLLETRMRLFYRWAEIESIVMERQGQPSNDPRNVVFVLTNGATAVMEIGGFQRRDIDQMLLALETYSPETRLLPEQKRATTQKLSFTRMWEEELDRRFGSTIFVPLEPEHHLQDGGIKIIGQIAFGGLSAIYLARRNDQMIVIKEAVVPSGADEVLKTKAQEMFQQEAQLLLKLDHPQIARVLDHFVEQGRHYLMLEYIDGKDLRDIVRERGPIPESTVVPWAIQIAKLLVYLHEQEPQIVHRDLTPDNLVLAADGNIILIDFGAANEFMGTATGTLVGKQSYISPEQFRGYARPASDLYSFGCTLHFLLTGQESEPLSVSRPSEVNNQVSSAMDLLVSSLTQLEVGDRLQTATQALAELGKMRSYDSPRSLAQL
jgi:tRNA A-37 threonylcarbamoyl transferase component Bud32